MVASGSVAMVVWPTCGQLSDRTYYYATERLPFRGIVSYHQSIFSLWLVHEPCVFRASVLKF